MTILKSLKYDNGTGRDPIKKHRTHRSKKNRTVTYGWVFVKRYKKKLESIRLQELEEDAKNVLTSTEI